MQDPASLRLPVVGDARQAFERACPLIYEDLRRLSRRYISRQKNANTLCPTELVNEALSKLWQQQVVAKDSQHLHAICARQMRYVLADRAKARSRAKRRGSCERLDTNLGNGPQTKGGVDIAELDSCLNNLEKTDAVAAQTVELHYFGGYEIATIAGLLGISISTVTRKLRVSKAWLVSQLGVD